MKKQFTAFFAIGLVLAWKAQAQIAPPTYTDPLTASAALNLGNPQMPDAMESSLRINQQVNKYIAARGSEFRSMNSFASKGPNFSQLPTGVAGPGGRIDQIRQDAQGWIRVYGGKGRRDADGNFSAYDSSTWGTIIGLDKTFEDLLVGLAGGYARSDLDGDANATDAEIIHGSLYANYDAETTFIDLALTYGVVSTEERSTGSDHFDSRFYSAYAGAGYTFNIGEKISLIPAASLLAAYYMQDGYARSDGGTVEDYDTPSILGSIGMDLTTQHQIDWLDRGIAYIPEIRAHYIHEFISDPDDFTYTIGGNPADFAVRPRDEHMLRFGLGLDLWNWKYPKTKYEIDYDGLFSDKYCEHIVSGKITWRF